MCKSLRLLITLVFIISSVATIVAQDKFEGRVKFTAYDDGDPTDINYFVKDKMVKIETEENDEGSFVVDLDKNEMTLIMNEEGMYMVFPMKKMMEKKDLKDLPVDEDMSFERTGDKMEILGYTAEKWIFKDDEDEGEAWLTNEIGSFLMFSGNPMGGESDKPKWQSDLERGGYFPLLVFENGEKVFEVKEIEEKSLQNSFFEPPAGFQKMDMPMMNFEEMMK